MNHVLAIYRRLLPLMRPYFSVLVLGSLLALVVAAMEGAIAWLVKPGTGNQGPEASFTVSPEFPRALFQKSREVIERQGRPHLASIYRQAAADLGRPPPDLISSDLAGPRNHLRKWS